MKLRNVLSACKVVMKNGDESIRWNPKKTPTFQKEVQANIPSWDSPGSWQNTATTGK